MFLNHRAVLESSFCSSSCCQACFPSIVRPMRNLCELTLKIFFDSPEMNRSILFSMYFLRMTKKMNYFLRNFVRRERMFPGSISIQFLAFIGMILGEEPACSLLCGFALPSIGMQNLLHSVLTHILRADILEFLFHCCSNSLHTFLIHEKI